MGNTVNNVTAGKPKVGGAVFRAPLGTTLPTAVDAVLDEAFKCLGYCSDAGLTNTPTINSNTVYAWGGDPVLDVQTSKTDEFGLTLIESINTDVLETVHGSDNVSGTLEAGITVKANSKELPASCWVIDTILTGGVKKRIVVPNGKVSSIGTVTYNDSVPTGYELGINALADSAGNTHYEYIK